MLEKIKKHAENDAEDYRKGLLTLERAFDIADGNRDTLIYWVERALPYVRTQSVYGKEAAALLREITGKD